jgi:hypothetical protein
LTTPPERLNWQERGLKARSKEVERAPRFGQVISATIHLAGEQKLRIDTYGSNSERGGHIAVASDSVLIYLYEQRAAKLYARAWIDAWYVAKRLPERVDVDPRGDTGPVMMVRAYASETVEHVHDTARDVAMIRVGRLTWLLHDRASWESATESWRQVDKLAPLVIAAQNNSPLPRRLGHRDRPIAPPSVDLDRKDVRYRDL